MHIGIQCPLVKGTALCSAPFAAWEGMFSLSAQLCKDSRALAGLRGCWERSRELLSLKWVRNRRLVTKWSPYSWGTKGFVKIIFLRPRENAMILVWTKSLKVKFLVRSSRTFNSKIISKAFTGRWTPNNTFKMYKSFRNALVEKETVAQGCCAWG